jgi:hypothetical protein
LTNPGDWMLRAFIEPRCHDLAPSFDRFRERGMQSEQETGSWMRAFSELLLSPPEVQILRVEEVQTS